MIALMGTTISTLHHQQQEWTPSTNASTIHW